MVDLKKIPRLEGWLTFVDAAKLLGVTHQRVRQYVERGVFFESELRRVGASMTVISEAGVARVERQRQEETSQ